jgi:glutaminyl-peptide cyclotransferase
MARRRWMVSAMRHRFRTLALLVSLASDLGCGRSDNRSTDAFEITNRYPHDASAYTQGLLRVDSTLYESTGLYGHSDLRRVDLRSGHVLASRPLAANRFGEGLALLNGRLYQVTWQSQVAYVYDAATLAPVDSFHYAGEGWGLTTDGTSLIMSDGSDSIRFISPKTHQVERVIHVRYQDAPLYKINALEWLDGEILANVYQLNWVLRIDPRTGLVKEALDFADLYADRPPSAEVMNGIAIAPDGKQLLLTGKYWPVLFQVRVRPPPENR